MKRLADSRLAGSLLGLLLAVGCSTKAPTPVPDSRTNPPALNTPERGVQKAPVLEAPSQVLKAD